MNSLCELCDDSSDVKYCTRLLYSPVASDGRCSGPVREIRRPGRSLGALPSLFGGLPPSHLSPLPKSLRSLFSWENCAKTRISHKPDPPVISSSGPFASKLYSFPDQCLDQCHNTHNPPDSPTLRACNLQKPGPGDVQQ